MMILPISGKEVKKKELRIYDENGKELEEIEAKEKIEKVLETNIPDTSE